jgi:hypothetical protein
LKRWGAQAVIDDFRVSEFKPQAGERDNLASERMERSLPVCKPESAIQSEKALSKQFESEGVLDFGQNDPLLIAKVDATLERSSGTLTLTELDGNANHKKGEKLSVHVWSGNSEYGIGYQGGQGANGKFDNLMDKGPIPKGDFLIGNGYNEPKVQAEHPHGDAWWYKLYGKDGKGGYSHEKLWNGRGYFDIHTGLESNGCVTVPSEAPKISPLYPQSTKFDQVKDMLDSTKPYEYKPGDEYKGWLHVK